MSDADIRELVRHRMRQAYAALGDADRLADGGSETGVINRSYYAMFYAVVALLQSIGKASSKHTGAIGLFDRHFVRTGLLPKALSKDLHWAFELRQACDYRAVHPASREDADEMRAKASVFVTAVAQHLDANSP